jgi:hypothetical protein
MANNALIRGAAEASKKFLDIGGAVAAGINATPDYVPSKNNRVAENKAIQAKVNNYMSKMKTDMDFTSFNPAETATMRNFLLSQRTIYTDAAKKAAEFDDTTDPDYMLYVDQMQNVNNSFTNLAAQLKSYKKSKLEYASNMQEGLYSNGNPGSKSKESAIIYGFYDADGDGRSEDKYDAPFQIQDGGNIAFNVDGQEISYNGMEEPFFKDTKFLNSLNKTSEEAYNSGLRGNANNPYAERAYDQQLNDTLQNENALRSIIFDFNAEAPMNDIGDRLDNGEIDLAQARIEVKDRLLIARENAYKKGKSIYNAKKLEQEGEGEGVGYFAIPKIAEALGIMQNKILNDTYFSDGVVDIINLKRQGKLGDSVTQTYYFTKNNDGKILISTSKEDVGNGQAKPRDTFDPANEADVKRAKEEFGIDIVPTF